MIKFLLSVLLFSTTAFAGYEFSYTYTQDLADIKVFVTEELENADVVAYSGFHPDISSSCWLKEAQDGEGTLKFLKVDQKEEADISVFFSNDLSLISTKCY